MADATPKRGDAVADELLELLTSWQRHLRGTVNARGRPNSPATIRTYRQSVEAYARFIRDHENAPEDVPRLVRSNFEDWLVQMRESGAKSWTIVTRFANLRTFMIWLVSEGEIPVSPMVGIRQPKADDVPVPVLAVDELKAMREVVEKRAERAGLGHIHPHQLRHTAAHELRMAGMNDQDMKRIFGWTSDKMLERYGASAADERAREAHRRYSLGDRL